MSSAKKGALSKTAINIAKENAISGTEIKIAALVWNLPEEDWPEFMQGIFGNAADVIPVFYCFFG